MKFRKKPIIIEAFQWNNEPAQSEEYKDFIGADVDKIRIVAVAGQDGAELRIETLEGIMTAYPGDWIIRGIKGELYPCKPDIFEATYEPA